MASPAQADRPPVTPCDNLAFIESTYAPRQPDASCTIYAGSQVLDSSVHSGSSFVSSAGPSNRHGAAISTRPSDDAVALDTISLQTSPTTVQQNNGQTQTGEINATPRTLVENEEPLRNHLFTEEVQFVKVGAMLTIFSFIAIFQGGTRFLDAQAMSKSWSQPGICMTSTLSLVQAVLEICFSIINIMIGLAVLTRRVHNRVITKVVMAPQALVTVYVLLYHFFPFSAEQIIGPAVYTTAYDDTYYNMVNTFISLQFYISLNGGILFFMARLVSLSARYVSSKTRTDKLLDKLSRNTIGGTIWNINLFLFGTWILTKGCISRQGMNVITGILVIICATWGLAIAAGHAESTTWYYIASENMILLSVLNLAVETAQNGSSRIA